ncbi:MAG TPA: IPT/TIG domain-containing protein [Thermoanaerobaculia bacterium]|nr:IPT/TIG domain-containing protein [Thermoanaerobaculia bacterium]
MLAAVFLYGAFPASAASKPKLEYGKLPLTFEANQGQFDPAVKFVSRGHRTTMFLTPAEAVVRLQGPGDSAVVRWQMAGGNHNVRVTGESALSSKSNYFRGNDAKQWKTDVPNFGRVRYENIYPGIDVVYHGNQKQIEYDFDVAPNANPNKIRMSFTGAQKITLGKDGALVLHTAAGDLVQPRPLVYQDIDGKRTIVDGRYALRARNEVGFVLGKYDRSHALVIDPVLAWSTYLGGSDIDLSYAVALDGSGNAYVTGVAGSTDFPTVNPIYGTKAFDWDVMVAKINAAGTAIVYSTYIGGDGGNEYGLTIATDSSGNCYVGGGTNSTDFPTVNPIQSTYGGTGAYRDAFALKINAAGSAILWSTYLGGSGDDMAYGITADSSGNAYVAGYTESSGLSWIGGSAIQSTYGGNTDGFVIKINSSGANVWSTYLGTSGSDLPLCIRLDGSGNVWVGGTTDSSSWPGVNGSSAQSTYGGNQDAFLTQINAAGTAINYSTYLGGSDYEDLQGIAVDSSGNVYVTGTTASTSFPGVTGSSIQSTNAGSYDLYVTKLNSTATSITWSTFLGGSDYDLPQDIGVDSSGNVYVMGSTLSSDFPVTNAIQPTYGGGIDAIAVRINAAGTAVDYATYLGGSGEDQGYGGAVDASGNFYITGFTASTDFIGTSGSAIQPTYGGGSYDAWVVKISNSASPSVTSLSPTSGVPGTQVTLTGTGFGAAKGTGSVWLGNKLAASIVSWSDTQVVATVASNVASGSGCVQQAGTWSNCPTFTIITPTISSISPTSGVPGTQVTINGTNFGSSQGSGQVWLGSTYAGSILSWSNTQIVATVAANSTTGNAQVQQSGVWGNQIAFTVTSPSISSISPTTARAGDQITINGTNFGSTQGSGQVWLGSKLAGSYVSWSNTQIVATVASGATSGVAQVKQSGVWGNTASLTILTPHVTSVSPTTARAGDSITITGTNFGSSQGSGSVWLGSKLAGSYTSWSDTQIVATVASGAVTGTAQVQQGGVWDNYGTFTVVTPVLSSISPTSGPVGTQVTFTGTGFGTSQGSGKVWLANKYATIVSWSDTQVVATVIAGSSTSASQVYQGGVWSNTITFTVTP